MDKVSCMDRALNVKQKVCVLVLLYPLQAVDEYGTGKFVPGITLCTPIVTHTGFAVQQSHNRAPVQWHIIIH